MKLTWLGHSAIRIETGSSVILIDPFLSGNEKYRGSVDEAARGCTHVILSHGHDDHVGDTVDICTKTGATLIAIYELAVYLNGQGVQNIDPANTGGAVTHADFEVSFVKAFHSSGTFVDGKPLYLGNPCGLVIHTKAATVYHMGDTEIFGDMALISEIYRPGIIFVPIGDRFTMGAKTAALACKKYFNGKTFVPIHYGTFPIIDPDASKFVAAMEGQNVLVPEIGKPFEI